MKTTKRQLSEVNGLVVSNNTLRKLSHPSANFLKVPVNIGDMLIRRANNQAWKDFRLYVKFLDLWIFRSKVRHDSDTKYASDSGA